MKRNVELKIERIRRDKSASYMANLLGYKTTAPYFEREVGRAPFDVDQIILIANDFGIPLDDFDEIKRVFFENRLPAETADEAV